MQLKDHCTFSNVFFIFISDIILITSLLYLPQKIHAQQENETIPSSAELEQLRALGYVGGTHENAPARQQNADFSPVTNNIISSDPFDCTSLPVTDLLNENPNGVTTQIAGRTRDVLHLPPGQAISFHGAIPPNTTLLFGVGQTYSQIKPNSLILQLDILDTKSKSLGQEIVSSVAGDWVDRSIDLAPYSSQNIRLVFSVKSLDPSQDENVIFIGPLLLTHPSQNQKMPHVFFILIDTLRVDALGCYGQSEPVTPHLDDLAEQGALFERMIAQAPHTETSIPSILQGVYPHEHGRMYRFSRHNSAVSEYVESKNLNPQYPSIAEVFQKAGYLTYGFYNNLLLSAKYGFNRGFYEYTDSAGEISDPWKKIALPTAHLGVDGAIEVIENVTDNIPLFLFLHILDPHNPYTPPNDFNLKVKKEAPKIDEAAYLGEVAFVDHQIGKLVQTLKQSGLFTNSIVLVTSDHGEEFVNPHGRPIGHGRTLFHTLLHVPFLCVFSGVIPPGLRIAPTVESIDIFPTVLDLAGLECEQPVSGQSLIHFLTKKEEISPKKEAIAEGIRRGEERKCLIRNGYKLVYFRDSNRTALYHLQNDPQELNDISTREPQIIQEMKERLFSRFRLKEPKIVPLQVNHLGQDGWDIVHTFKEDASDWLPGLCDIHLKVNPIPTDIARIEIWADDRLHGNRNYMYGWNWPANGEWPIAIDRNKDSLDLYFEALESLHGSTVFVRLTGQDGQLYLGSFHGQNVAGPKRDFRTNHPVIGHWDFENSDSLQSWKAGQNGELNLFKQKIGNRHDTFLQFESKAPSGTFRVFHLIPKVPANRRVLVSFDLVLLSGGVQVELIHPQSSLRIASHTYSLQESSSIHNTKISPKRIIRCGVTGIAEHEEELLLLLSNSNSRDEGTQAFLNNIQIMLYPSELETSVLTYDSDIERDL